MFEVNIEKSGTIQLPDLIDSVVNGEEVIFTHNNLPVAKLVAWPQPKPQPKFGSGKGLFEMADDFEAPLADFVDYLK
jgi:antitoxin (DNA-binding transcriptional repressor) of toxin-antitoxin stability system